MVSIISGLNPSVYGVEWNGGNQAEGFHSIFFIDRNYGCCLVKHSQEDIRWEPGDPGDDIMLLQLDSGMYQIIKSSQIELMAKQFLNEDWSILGDIYLDHFQNFG